MKKLYLFLAAMIVSLAASAVDYYLVGEPKWTLKDETCKFTPASDGTYTLDVPTLVSGFKINDGTWDNASNNWGTAQANTYATPGEPLTLVASANSNNIFLKEDLVNAHLVFNPTAKTLTVTGDADTEVPTFSWRLWGQLKSTEWTALNLTEGTDGIWTATTDIQAGSFGIQKVNDKTQATTWFAAASGATAIGEAQVGKAISFTDTNCSDFKSTLAGNYTIAVDPENQTITFTKAGDDPEPPVPPVPSNDLYIVGTNFGSWAPAEAYKMTADGNVYTIELPEGLSGEWKIWNGEKDEKGNWTYSFGAGGTQPEVGTEYDAWFNSAANFTVSTTTKTTVQLTVTEGSDVTNSSTPAKLLITADGGDDPIPPTPVDEYAYYLHNNVFGDWASTPLTEEDGLYTVTADGTAGQFLVKVVKNGDEETAAWYSAPANASTVEEANLDTALPLVLNGQNYDFNLNGNFTFSLNAEDMTITIKRNGEIPPTPVDNFSWTVYGNLDGSKDWTATALEGETTVLTATATAAANSQFGIQKLNNGKQVDWFAAAEADATIDAAALDKAISLINADQTNFTIAEAGDYVFTLDTEAMTLTVSKDEVVPPVPVTVSYQLFGALEGQEEGEPWVGYDFAKDGDVYVYSGEVQAGEFGIKVLDEDGTQTAWYAAPKGEQTIGTEQLDKALTLAAEEIQNFEFTLTGDFQFILDPVAMTLTVKENCIIPPVPDDKTYKFHGTIQTGEWIDLATTEENGKWSYTGSVIAGQLGIKVLDEAGEQTAWYAGVADANTIDAETLDQEITVVAENGVNFENKLAGNYTFTFDPATMTLTVSEAGDIPTPELELYLMSPASDWKAAEEYKFTEEDGTYTLTVESLEGEFKVASADWTAANYGAPAEENNVLNGVAMNAVPGSQFNFNLASALNNVTIKFVINADKTATLTVSGTDGLNAIYTAEGNIRVANGAIVVEGAAEYSVFTTGGALVARNHAAQVEPGFYIVVVGNKAQKVVVK